MVLTAFWAAPEKDKVHSDSSESVECVERSKSNWNVFVKTTISRKPFPPEALSQEEDRDGQGDAAEARPAEIHQQERGL